MEHLIKEIKGILRDLGPTSSESRLDSVCNAAPLLSEMKKNLDSILGLHPKPPKKQPEKVKDVFMVLEALKNAKSFFHSKGRKMTKIGNLKFPTESANRKKFKDRIERNQQAAVRVKLFYHLPFHQTTETGEEEIDNQSDDSEVEIPSDLEE